MRPNGMPLDPETAARLETAIQAEQAKIADLAEVLATYSGDPAGRRLQDATVKAYHYDHLESLKAHVLAFVTAYNFAKHLKALRWRTPFQVIREAWTKDRSIFKIDPHQLIPGPHT